MSLFSRLKDRLTPFQIIILQFAGMVLIGALLLMLPISSKSHVVTGFDKALFTATSAGCVTGLVVEDTASYWSYFGQAVILILIQIGGLGVITVASFVAMLAGRKITLSQRQTMQNALAAPQLGGMVKLTRFIFLTAFLVEGAGALCLMPIFVPRYGLKGIWMSFFHAISAFCNAGFDLMGTESGKFSSLTAFSGNIYLTIIISLIIIIGGLGFLTWNDIVTKKLRFREYRMQTKVVLVTTLALLVVPALFFFFYEFKDAPLKERICEAVFQSVSPRTAGFNTADYTEMSGPGRALTMILMLVGGSPGSTAGGMKTTTIAVLFASSISVFKKKKNATLFGRRIDDSVIKDAAAILFLYVVLAVTAAIAISILEGLPMHTSMFESISAIATVGLTMGATPSLGIVSRIILICLMFFGRVGGLTLIFATFSHQDMTDSKYPKENIIVG